MSAKQLTSSLPPSPSSTRSKSAILLNLQLQRALSADFSEAVIAKVPVDLQGKAKALVQGIDDSFAKAIKKYSSLRG
jgi:hypothetical protein